MPLQYVTLTGTFRDGTGAPLTGTVTFTPSATIYADGVPVITADNPIQGQIISGELRSPSDGMLELLATDNSGITIIGNADWWFWEASHTIGGQVQSAWQFLLPYSSSPVDLVSLANQTLAPFVNPMTSGGNIIGGASGSLKRLRGNATAARESLVSQSTGTAAQAPSWSALDEVSDIPSLSALYHAAGAAVSAQSLGEAASSLPSGGGPFTGQYPGAVGGTQDIIWTTLINDRGAIGPSTAYEPGDMVAYRGQRILVTQATTSSAWNPWYSAPSLTAGTYIPITSEGVYYASDWGVVMDGTTDNSTALNRALQYMYDSSTGGFLALPGGNNPGGQFCAVAATVIIPPNCFIVGQGIEASAIRLLSGADCDVIQFQTYGSASQAAIVSAATGVTISQYSLRNAFNAGLMHLTVDGNQGSQGASSYNYGVNITTNPLTSEASTDPGFDPTNILLNVEVRGCTGDGFYHDGRSALRVSDCVFRYNNGGGAIPSFDTIFTNCQFGGNGLGGVYVNHNSCNGAGNKSYNNGANPQWASGSNYSARAVVMYGGAMYRAINALTNDTTAPSSDTANWTALSANAPQAWGIGYYFDSNASECAWAACDAQQNAASDYCLHDAAAVLVQGVSRQPASGAASNPDYYSSLVLDGALGCTADIAFSQLNSLAYALRAVNGATRNDVRMTGDTTYQAILSPDSLALVGSGNSVRVNGTPLTETSLLATTDDSGFALQNGTPTILSWTAPDDGQLHRVTLYAVLNVTSTETGGQIQLDWYGPWSGSAAYQLNIFNAEESATTHGSPPTISQNLLIGPGTTVSLVQSSALTAGAATVYAEIWGL